jgi:hypothetical protein
MCKIVDFPIRSIKLLLEDFKLYVLRYWWPHHWNSRLIMKHLDDVTVTLRDACGLGLAAGHFAIKPPDHQTSSV